MKMSTKWVFSLASVAAPLVAAGTASADTVFNVNNAFLTDVMSNAPSTQNGGFAYGYTADPATSSGFATSGLTYTPTFASNTNLSGFFVQNNAIVPALVINTSSSAIAPTNIGVTSLQGNELLLHPGGLGSDAFSSPVDADLRYDVQTTGLYSISGMFRQLSSGVTVDSVYVSGQTAPLFTTSSSGTGGPTSFSETALLTAGQTVDFTVGVTPGTSIANDSTGLFANVAAVTPMPKSSYGGLAVLGGLGLTQLRRKQKVATA